MAPGTLCTQDPRAFMLGFTTPELANHVLPLLEHLTSKSHPTSSKSDIHGVSQEEGSMAKKWNKLWLNM
jgi:hypothetical protein